MKRIILAVLVAFLLAGCTKEIKESRQESEKATYETENIQKSETTMSDEEMAYMRTLEKTLQALTDNATNIQGLMQQASKDPSIATTDEWMIALRGNFISISLMAELFQQMDDEGAVPEDLTGLHTNALESLKLMSEAGDKLIEAVESNDQETFNESFELMAQSNVKLVEVTKELREINSK